MTFFFAIIISISIFAAIACLLGSIAYDIQQAKVQKRPKRKQSTKPTPIITPTDLTSLKVFFSDCFALPVTKTGHLLGARPTLSTKKRQRKHTINRILPYVHLFITFAITYSVYAVIVNRHIEPVLYLLTTAIGYGIAAIILHDRLTWLQRLYAFFLLPGALWYYLYSCYRTLLERVTNVIKAKIPVGVGFLLRVKNILWIV